MSFPPSTGVRLGEVFLPAYTGAPLDEHGVQWKLTKLDGWFDGWEGSGSVDQKTQAHGAWVSPQYASARVVHLGGSLQAMSWDDATRAWDRLLGGLPFEQLATLRVSTGEGTMPELTALVRQHEKPLTERYHGRIKFSLSLLAPDPRRYDSASRSTSLVLPISSGGLSFPITFPISFPVSTSRSQVTLTNDGNFTTYPTLVVVGPCPPATIANLATGEARRVVDPVPADRTLVIDELLGTAATGGQARKVLGTPLGLRQGANEIAFSAAEYDAGAQLLISYRSAWK